MRSLAVLSLVAALSGCGKHSSACDEGTRKQDVVAAVTSFYLYQELLPRTFSASAYASADEVLSALTATARDQGMDRGWSFLMPEDQYRQYFQDAQSVGYGMSLLTIGAAPSFQVFVKQVFAGSAAAQAGFVRGDQILAAGPGQAGLTEVAGLTADQVSALLSAGGVSGVSKALRVLPLGGGAEQIRTMVSAPYDVDPVPSVRVFGTTGYVQLRTFITAANAPLRTAFASFKSQGVQNVVVDLRYNGGGSVDTAALLADLLAGGLDGQPMVDLRFNGNHPDQTAAGQYAFHVQPESGTFQRVAFITTDASASASELVPNVLDAYPASVHIAYVGTRTYGKPVGQVVLNLSACNTVLFLVSFRLVNANENVDYYDGLPDAASNGPLCDATDDLTHAQDSQDEAFTAAAIHFAETGECLKKPPAARAVSPAQPIDQLSAAARTPVQRDMPGTF
jgi:carboxyl-terminal processing protease